MFTIDRLDEIETKQLHEWKDNPVQRYVVSVDALRADVETKGLASPITVVPNGKGYIVVDGNRRLKLARDFGIDVMKALVYAKGTDIIALAMSLNGFSAVWDLQTMGQLVADNLERLEVIPERHKKELLPIITLLGSDFKSFITSHKPAAYQWGMKAARYIGEKEDKEFGIDIRDAERMNL